LVGARTIGWHARRQREGERLGGGGSEVERRANRRKEKEGRERERDVL